MTYKLFLLKPVKTNFVFVVTMLLLGTICELCVVSKGSRMLGLVELWFDVYVMAVVLTLLPSSARRIVTRLLYVLCYVLALVDVYLYYTTGQPITPQLITLVVLTNPREAQEAIDAYLTFKPFCSPWVAIWALLFFHYFFLRKCTFYHRLWQRVEKSKTALIALEIGLLLSVVASAITVGEDKVYKYYRLVLGKSELETQKIVDLSPKIYYQHPVYRFLHSTREYLSYHTVVRELSENIQLGEVDACSYTSPQIIFIIGESYNKHHSQLYGYEKATTPHQLSHRDQGNLVVFEDVVSSWNTTCESLQNIFSLSYYGDDAAWYKKPFFTTLFRKARYDVTFLSNQYTLDPAQSVSNFIEDIFINIPGISEVQFNHRNPHRYTYDGDLLQHISLQQMDAGPHLLILHLMGSHFNYDQRYPASHQYFKPQDYHRPDLSANELEILAHYDNSIRYNDSLLHQVLQTFEEREAIIIHIADHGEQVFDYGNAWGRSLGDSYGEVRQQFEIPMWIWCSEAYKKAHPDVWDAIVRQRTLPFMTDAIGHTLLNIAGINTGCYVPQVDVLSPHYNPQRRRIIKESVDYDQLVKQQTPTSKHISSTP